MATEQTNRAGGAGPALTGSRPPYKPPLVVPLGDLARSAGYCSGGASNFNCTNGPTPLGTCVLGTGGTP